MCCYIVVVPSLIVCLPVSLSIYVSYNSAQYHQALRHELHKHQYFHCSCYRCIKIRRNWPDSVCVSMTISFSFQSPALLKEFVIGRIKLWVSLLWVFIITSLQKLNSLLSNHSSTCSHGKMSLNYISITT